jgi:hypothetical protein
MHIRTYGTNPQLRLLAAGFSPQIRGFNSLQLHVRIMMDEMKLEQVFIRVYSVFSC